MLFVKLIMNMLSNTYDCTDNHDNTELRDHYGDWLYCDSSPKESKGRGGRRSGERGRKEEEEKRGNTHLFLGVCCLSLQTLTLS